MKPFAALLLALILSLSGCASISLAPVQEEAPVTLPQPGALPKAPQGDSRVARSENITLYHISSDQQYLSPISRTVRVLSDESTAQKAIQRLLEGTGTPSLLPAAPQGTQLEWLEVSQGVATLSLSVDALALDGKRLCWMKEAIANTLIGLEGIQYVNVLIDGKEESALTLPTGALSRNQATLTAIWAQLQSDDQRFHEDPAAAQITRDIPLYFGADAARLLPQIRQVTFVSGNPAQDIIEQLKLGPQDGHSLPVISADAQLKAPPETVTLEDGRRVLLISFDGNLPAQLERDGISQSRMLSALSFTLCRAIPQLDGVAVGLDGVLITRTSDGLERMFFQDGVVKPGDFNDAVARMATLYFSAGEGMLAPVKRPMDLKGAVSPRALMGQLIAGPLEGDGQAFPVVPMGVQESDVLGVRIEDGCVLVNLSSNFYRLCQGITQAQERSLVYAMVNTLCQLEGVDRVRFYVAGEAVDSLSGWIYLKSELLPNPGLVRQQEREEAAHEQ